MIRFTDVHKRFGDHRVLRGVSLHVPRAQVHVIIGRSGAGKSVLIKQVVGLLTPDAGSITFEGRELSGAGEDVFRDVRRRCQYIFQHATLLDALSVEENVALPLRKRFGLPRREARARAREALARVHAEGYAEARPAQLGSGVNKRVAIARALALEPHTLLYDEPTTGLDPVSARRIDRLVREAADAMGITAVVVSHDLHSVRGIADQVSFLQDGRIIFQGTPGELFGSEDKAVSDFVHGRPGDGLT